MRSGPGVVETFEQVHRLRDIDFAHAMEIMELLDDGSDAFNPKGAVKKIAAIKVKYLIAICANEDFFCIKEVCETDPLLEAHWNKQLKKYNYPDFMIELVDGSKKLSSFSMLSGAYYYGRYLEWKKTFEEDPASVQHAWQFLMAACDAGVYFAWRDRHQLECELLMMMCQAPEGEENVSTVHEDLSCHVDRMLTTAGELGNRFWSAGYFTGGIDLDKAARQLAEHPTQKRQLHRLKDFGRLPASEDDYPLCLKLMAGAVRSYYAAWLLSERDYSIRLVEFLSPQGLFPSGDIEGWDELRAFVISELQNRFLLPPLTAADFMRQQLDRVMDAFADVEAPEPSMVRNSP